MRFWTESNNILIYFAASLALAACAPGDGAARFAVQQAAIAGDALDVRLDWQPGETLLDGLDHGIPLVFDIALSAQSPDRFGWQTQIAQRHWRRELRYFPLTRQYQLRDADGASKAGLTRSYSVRALLIAAFADLRLPLDAAFAALPARRYVLRVDLERDALPGVLRLPALVDADWRLSTGDYAWPATSDAR